MGRIVKLAGIVIGCLLMLYGGGALGLSFVTKMHTTVEWYTQVAGYIGGGLAVIAGTLVAPVVLSQVKKINIYPDDSKEEQPMADKPEDKVTANTQPVSGDWAFLIENYDHLERLVGQLDGEADKKLCRDLQKRLLELHHEKKTKTKTNSA